MGISIRKVGGFRNLDGCMSQSTRAPCLASWRGPKKKRKKKRIKILKYGLSVRSACGLSIPQRPFALLSPWGERRGGCSAPCQRVCRSPRQTQQGKHWSGQNGEGAPHATCVSRIQTMRGSGSTDLEPRLGTVWARRCGQPSGARRHSERERHHRPPVIRTRKCLTTWLFPLSEHALF